MCKILFIICLWPAFAYSQWPAYDDSFPPPQKEPLIESKSAKTKKECGKAYGALGNPCIEAHRTHKNDEKICKEALELCVKKCQEFSGCLLGEEECQREFRYYYKCQEWDNDFSKFNPNLYY